MFPAALFRQATLEVQTPTMDIKLLPNCSTFVWQTFYKNVILAIELNLDKMKFLKRKSAENFVLAKHFYTNLIHLILDSCFLFIIVEYIATYTSHSHEVYCWSFCNICIVHCTLCIRIKYIAGLQREF